MNRGIITINETGIVTMPKAPVWMTKFEIADLFGVFSCDIRKAIWAIYKNKELSETDTKKYIKQPDGISYDVYSLEMIIAIAFKICSKETLLFRRFIINEICATKRGIRLSCSSLVARAVTYGIIEAHPSATCSRCSDAKVAYGSDGIGRSGGRAVSGGIFLKRS